MEVKFQTQEGDEYILKTATQYTDDFAVPPYPTAVSVTVNVNPTAPASNVYFIDIKTNNRIIPVSYSISIVNHDDDISLVDITSPYFIARNSDNTLNNSYYRALGKLYPYVERQFFTNANFYNYQVQYNQLVFSTDDFVQTPGYLYFLPCATLQEAMANNRINVATIPEETQLRMRISFTYFEMVK